MPHHPLSLGSGSLFVPECFKKGQHPLSNIAAAAAAAIALSEPLHRHGAAAIVAGCERREGCAIHRVGPFDL